jgi:very-short-patch-repair endonuclease
MKEHSKYHSRSKLEEEVELILRNLNLKFSREQPYKCYKVDFMVNSIVLEVFGPSHYIPRSRVLKGNEEVKKKIIEK